MAYRLLLILNAAFAAAATSPTSFGGHSDSPYWFKNYPLSPYQETWTGEISVPDFPRDLPKVLKAIEKAGGTLTQPVENLASSKKDQIQQLIFAIPRSGAVKSLKALRKIGELPAPAVRISEGLVPLEEVKKKIDLLMKERAEHGVDLAKVPASAAASQEILEHLLLVEEVTKTAKEKVLFNLQVRTK